MTTSARRARPGRALVAWLALAAVVAAGFALTTAAFTSSGSSAAALNVAGRQRMLSQRLAVQALLLTTPQTVAERERSTSELRQAADRMLAEQEALLSGDPERGLPGDPPPEVLALLAGDGGLDRAVSDLTSRAHVVARHAEVEAAPLAVDDRDVAALLAEADGDLLARLELLVAAYQRVDDARGSRLVAAGAGWTGATVLAVGLWGACVSRPRTRRLERARADDAQELRQVRAVVDALPTGALLLDGEDRVRVAGPLCAVHLRRRVSELVGRRLPDVLDAGDAALVESALTAVREPRSGDPGDPTGEPVVTLPAGPGRGRGLRLRVRRVRVQGGRDFVLLLSEPAPERPGLTPLPRAPQASATARAAVHS